MTHSNGNPSKRRDHAVLYREWRANRSIYGIAFLAILAPYLLSFMANTLSQNAYAGYVGNYIVGQFSIITFVVAGILGIAVMWHDRMGDHLADVLEGPVSRRQFIGAKIRGSAITLTASGVMMALGVSALCFAIGRPQEIGVVLLRDFWLTSGALAIAMTSLAMASAMGSLLFAAAGTAVWPLLPILAGSVYLSMIFHSTYPGHPVSQHALMRSNQIWAMIQHFSPFAPTVPFQHGSIFGYGVEYMAIAAAFGYAAMTWWYRAESERMRDPMVFPFLWNLYYAALALLTGGMGSVIVIHFYFASSASSLPLYVFWSIFALVGWFVWRWAHLWIGRRTTLRWGPGIR